MVGVISSTSISNLDEGEKCEAADVAVIRCRRDN